jgi:hypothetical protein
MPTEQQIHRAIRGQVATSLDCGKCPGVQNCSLDNEPSRCTVSISLISAFSRPGKRQAGLATGLEKKETAKVVSLLGGIPEQ